jgi:EpsI family protein
MIVRALVLTCCFVATSGYLAYAARAEPTPIRSPLAGLPFEVGGWRGRALAPFTEEVLAQLRVDDYTTRQYVHDGQAIGLYVGYHATQRQGASIHSPLNCLPGAGWLPVNQDRTRIRVRDAHGAEREIDVNRVVIQKGVERQLVVYWYQSHGRIVASEYWGKVYSVLDSIRYNRSDAALVRVMAPIAGDGRADLEASEQAVSSFVVDLFPLLERHLPS